MKHAMFARVFCLQPHEDAVTKNGTWIEFGAVTVGTRNTGETLLFYKYASQKVDGLTRRSSMGLWALRLNTYDPHIQGEFEKVKHDRLREIEIRHSGEPQDNEYDFSTSLTGLKRRTRFLEPPPRPYQRR